MRRSRGSSPACASRAVPFTAPRWLDVDWSAGRIRVRRNFVRGEFGTPKSKRSSRSVPLPTRVARELALLYQRSMYKADEELVFAHPHTGKPIDRSRLLKRFKGAVRRADVRDVRFHDLRHTFGTRMAAQGVPMRTLQEMLGHRDFKTTLIYATTRQANERSNGWNQPSPRTYRVSHRRVSWTRLAQAADRRPGANSHGGLTLEGSGPPRLWAFRSWFHLAPIRNLWPARRACHYRDRVRLTFGEPRKNSDLVDRPRTHAGENRFGEQRKGIRRARVD